MENNNFEGREHLIERFQDQLEDRARRVYPAGKLNQEDEGALAAVLTTNEEQDKLIIDFGKKVTWIAMTPDEAILFGTKIVEVAHRMKEK